MARPLEFKRRVQLSERDLDLKPPRARARSTPLVLGVIAYGCAFALAWGVSTNRLPIAETFTRALAPPAEAKPRPRVELQASLPTEIPSVPAMAVTIPDPRPPAPDEQAARELAPAEPAAQEPATQQPATQQPATPEPAPEAPAVGAPAPALEPAQATASGGSCEAAIAAYVEDANQKAPKDLAAADFGRVLNKGDYLERCGVPTTTAVDVCVAVQNGRALGVTVRTTPANSKLDRCLARVLRGVSFPSHPRMDVARTRFAN